MNLQAATLHVVQFCSRGQFRAMMVYALVDANEDVVVLDNLSTGSSGAVPSKRDGSCESR
jgi:hypothetical protein